MLHIGTVRLTEGVVFVGHDIGESIGDVTTLDDLLGLVCLVRKQEEGEDDTSEEQPTTNAERNVYTAVGLVFWTTVEDGV